MGIPENLYKKTMGDMALIADVPPPAAFKEPPSILVFIGITVTLLLVVWILTELANWREITNNWDMYKCRPDITPFSKFYGYDLGETMNFCIGEAVKNNSGEIIVPIYKGIEVVSKTVEGVYDSAKAIEGGVMKLLGGFQTFLMQFANSFRLIGTRIRISLVKIRDIFDRVFGIFMSFAMAGITAITFGENLMCNPIVTFIGTIAGVDICCFAPNTMIELEDGCKPISEISIGTALYDGTVTSVFLFDGTETEMVNLYGVIVSTNHAVEYQGRFIEAGNHPQATSTASLDRIYCLSTTSNRIHVRTNSSLLVFTDYEETSDKATMDAAKAAAETALSAIPSEVQDFSLGLDPATIIRTSDGYKQLRDIRIGDKLHGSSSVIGIIKEKCKSCVRVGNIIVSAAQLIHGPTGWVRAASLFPHIDGHYTLLHIILSDNQPIHTLVNGSHILFRDYMEVHIKEVQAPYDHYIKNLIVPVSS